MLDCPVSLSKSLKEGNVTRRFEFIVERRRFVEFQRCEYKYV